MSLVPEMIKGGFHSLVERIHPHAPETENPTTHQHPLGPQSKEEIPWDKFKKFFSALPESVAKARAKTLFGDVYTATRTSGREMTIVPIHFQGWRSEKSSIDMLLILAFNEAHGVVGMRTVAMDLSLPGLLTSQGSVASVVCNEGIASALEQVRHRTSTELLMAYRDKGFHFDRLDHTIVDENRKVVDILKDKTEKNASDPLMRERYDHALFDRPRWETLFDPRKSGFAQKGHVIQIMPDDAVNRGFRSADRTGWRMARLPTQSGRAEWSFENMGPDRYSQVADSGLLDKNYVQLRMKKAIEAPPET